MVNENNQVFWVPTTVWVLKAVRVLSWASQFDHIFAGLRGLEIWYGSHVWDPGGVYSGLGFLILRRLCLLALLFILRLNDLWFGVEDGLHSLLVFLLIFIPYILVEIMLYCFNEFQLDYCTVSTTIECIGEQCSLCFWDEDSLHQLIVSLFFYFQEVSFNLVSEQPIRQLVVCSALGFHINLHRLVLAPAIVQNALINDCNRNYI